MNFLLFLLLQNHILVLTGDFLENNFVKKFFKAASPEKKLYANVIRRDFFGKAGPFGQMAFDEGLMIVL